MNPDRELKRLARRDRVRQRQRFNRQIADSIPLEQPEIHRHSDFASTPRRRQRRRSVCLAVRHHQNPPRPSRLNQIQRGRDRVVQVRTVRQHVARVRAEFTVARQCVFDLRATAERDEPDPIAAFPILFEIAHQRANRLIRFRRQRPRAIRDHDDVDPLAAEIPTRPGQRQQQQRQQRHSQDAGEAARGPPAPIRERQRNRQQEQFGVLELNHGDLKSPGTQQRSEGNEK